MNGIVHGLRTPNVVAFAVACVALTACDATRIDSVQVGPHPSAMRVAGGDSVQHVTVRVKVEVDRGSVASARALEQLEAIQRDGGTASWRQLAGGINGGRAHFSVSDLIRSFRDQKSNSTLGSIKGDLVPALRYDLGAPGLTFWYTLVSIPTSFDKGQGWGLVTAHTEANPTLGTGAGSELDQSTHVTTTAGIDFTKTASMTLISAMYPSLNISSNVGMGVCDGITGSTQHHFLDWYAQQDFREQSSDSDSPSAGCCPATNRLSFPDTPSVYGSFRSFGAVRKSLSPRALGDDSPPGCNADGGGGGSSGGSSSDDGGEITIRMICLWIDDYDANGVYMGSELVGCTVSQI